MVGEAVASIVLKVIVKIPSEMEVARLYTLFTLFILFKLLYTAYTVACMYAHILLGKVRMLIPLRLFLLLEHVRC